MIGMLLLSNCVIYIQLKLEFVLVLKIAYIIKKNRGTEQGFRKVHKQNFGCKKTVL
jgi:hypothetical protein